MNELFIYIAHFILYKKRNVLTKTYRDRHGQTIITLKHVHYKTLKTNIKSSTGIETLKTGQVKMQG